MSEFLKTNRVTLRNFREEDFPAVHSWRNDPRCARFQRWEDTTESEVREYLHRHGADVFLSEQEAQHYALADKNGTALGELAWFYNPEDACITLGITIGAEFQGNGLAFEVLSAVIRRCREAYPDLDIVALIHPDNLCSIRLFEKLGFEQECYAKSIESWVYTIFARKVSNGT